MDAKQAVDDPRATPEAILAMVEAGPTLDPEVEELILNRLVERFPATELTAAITARLAHLGTAAGGIVLRLLEAQGASPLMEGLAVALLRQPDLPPDRAWEALAVLESAGQLDRHPELAERWDELNDAIEGDEASDSLAAQLEEEPAGSWVALEGLGAIEPATRREIIASLAGSPTGPGLVAFLRLLAHAHDDSTRAAALEALFDPRRDDDRHRSAWAELAADHFDPKVRERARRRLAIGGATDDQIDATVAAVAASPGYPRPELVGSLVSAVDGSGVGTILLASRDRDSWVVASFTCDVADGIVAVQGQVGSDPSVVASCFDEFVATRPGEVVEDAVDLAVVLLAKSWYLSGPATNPALRFWIERTVGPRFPPDPVGGAFDSEDVAAESLAHLAGPSWLILESCASWVDRSPLTFDLAEEITLRSGDATPDPRRDSGAFRYLFEHHLTGRLAHYHRLLLWMASFWQASGDDDLARSAVALAWQLADPQNAVPGHPFVVALTTRSLAAAQTDLRAGLDPRRG